MNFLISSVYNWFRLFHLPSHRRNVKAASRVLSKVGVMGEWPRALGYMRKVPPQVFEELVLSVFERSGFLVQRGRRYSGDGGVDGRVWLAGRGFCSVQCKRYSGHVDMGHVREFADLCKREGRPGLFVHTGRTGSGSAGEARGSGLVAMVSGQDLALAAMGKRDAGEVLAKRLAKLSGRA